MTDARRTEWDSTGTGMNNRAKASASEGEHLLLRSVTLGKDQVLGFKDEDLVVFANEYATMQSDRAYRCKCGEEFDGIDEAEEHLREVRNDGS